MNINHNQIIDEYGLEEECSWKGWRCNCGAWDALGGSAVEPLIKKLEETEDIETQQNIVGALGSIGDKRAVDPIIKLLEEKKSKISFHAVAALGQIGDNRATETIIQALGYDEESATEYWLEGKETPRFDMADEPVTNRCKLNLDLDALAHALGDNVESVRSRCVGILDGLNWKPKTEKQQIDYLIASIVPPSNRSFSLNDNLTKIAKKLIRIGEPAVPNLIKALKTDGKPDRIRRIISRVAYTLGRIGDERAVEPLLEVLENNLLIDEYNQILNETARALGELGSSKAVEPLVKKFVKLTPSDDDRKYRDLDERFNQDTKDTYAILANSLKKLSGVEAVGHQIWSQYELYDKAEEWYNYHGMMNKATDIRRKKADLAATKTIIQGDYVDDRDTIVKDSVINKSNIGTGGKSKSEELREAKALLDDGIIDDDEFKQMKKEILGK